MQDKIETEGVEASKKVGMPGEVLGKNDKGKVISQSHSVLCVDLYNCA